MVCKKIYVSIGKDKCGGWLNGTYYTNEWTCKELFFFCHVYKHTQLLKLYFIAFV